jgi:phosphoglucosamine mutase
LKKIDKLPGNLVVSTVMSNLGLGRSMAAEGIKHLTTAVGDRHVMSKMRATGAVLGGEDSGHVIFSDHHTTGDGIFSGLRLLEIMVYEHQNLSQLSRCIKIFPQKLLNVNVLSKPPLESIPEISAAVDSARAELGDQGRVLVRYSGTQPCCRVMVEGPTDRITRSICRQIADVIQDRLGS